MIKKLGTLMIDDGCSSIGSTVKLFNLASISTSSNETEANDLIPDLNSRKKVSVELFIKSPGFRHYIVLNNVFPEIKKYTREELSQEEIESRFKLLILLDNGRVPCVFYVPYNTTFSFFIADSGLNLNQYYYVDNFLISKDVMQLTIGDLIKIGLLDTNVQITVSKKKKRSTNDDWKTINPENLEYACGEFS